MMVYFSEPIGDDYISSTNGLDGMMEDALHRYQIRFLILFGPSAPSLKA